MDVTVFHLMPWQSVEDDIGWPFSTDRFEPVEGAARYEEYLSQLAYAEELGFDAVGLNEHHFSAFGLMPSPNVMAANLAARTDTVDITVYGNVLPLRGHPIRVAEELAMIDNLCEGRLTSGFVRGIPSEYAAYGVDPDESRGRFAEAWELIVRAWTEEEPFDFDGEYFCYEDVYIWPRPYQDPHPPLVMPAESEKSIQFAVEKQVPIGRVFVSTSGLRNTYDRYRALAEQAGWTAGPAQFAAARMVHVAEDMETARANAEEPLRYFYEDLLGAVFKAGAVQAVGDTEYREENAFAYEQAASEKALDVMNFDFDEYLDRGEIIVGDPAYVTEELRDQYEATGGFENLIGSFQFGTLSDEQTRRSLELFADEVLPEIEDL